MRPRGKIFPVGVLLLGLLAGCATSTETDATKVTAGDLWSQKRLQEYLAAQRKILAGLQIQADELETKVLIQAGRLQKVRNAQAQSNRESAAALAEKAAIAEEQRKAEAMLDQIGRAKAEIEKSRIAAQQENQAALAVTRERQQQLQAEVKRLESEVALINDSIERTLRLREEEMLREK